MSRTSLDLNASHGQAHTMAKGLFTVNCLPEVTETNRKRTPLEIADALLKP